MRGAGRAGRAGREPRGRGRCGAAVTGPTPGLRRRRPSHSAPAAIRALCSPPAPAAPPTPALSPRSSVPAGGRPGSRGAPPRHSPGPPALRPPLTRCPGRAAQQPQSHGRAGPGRAGAQGGGGSAGRGGAGQGREGEAAPVRVPSAPPQAAPARFCSPASINRAQPRLGSRGSDGGLRAQRGAREIRRNSSLHSMANLEQRHFLSSMQ